MRAAVRTLLASALLLLSCTIVQAPPAPVAHVALDSDTALFQNGGGCYPTDSNDHSLAEIVLVNPEWAPAAGGAHVESEPVLVHGRVLWVHGDTGGDVPWTHSSSDYNVGLDPDPEDQFRLASGNLADKKPELEIEWEAGMVPPWAWAGEGDREVAVGRWIFDCGHPDLRPRTCIRTKDQSCTVDQDCPSGDACDRQHYGYTTEIHPPHATAVIREGRGGQLSVDPGAPGLPATRADVWVSKNGGAAGDRCVVTHQAEESDVIFKQDCYPLGAPLADINREDFVFEIPLPPRPSASAKMVWRELAHVGSGPVPAKIALESKEHEASPSIVVRVLLTQAEGGLLPTGYASTLWAGWDVPPAEPLIHVRVTVDAVEITDALHPAHPVVREVKRWHLQVSVNGEWQAIDMDGVESGMTFPQALVFDQWLPKDGALRIVADGTVRACIDTLFGKSLKDSIAELGIQDTISCLETNAEDPGKVDKTHAGPTFGAGPGEMRYEEAGKAFVLKYRVALVP